MKRLLGTHCGETTPARHISTYLLIYPCHTRGARGGRGRLDFSGRRIDLRSIHPLPGGGLGNL